MSSPVSQRDSSEARNTAMGAMSEGCPTRPSGVMAIICLIDRLGGVTCDAIEPMLMMLPPRGPKYLMASHGARGADGPEIAACPDDGRGTRHPCRRRERLSASV